MIRWQPPSTEERFWEKVDKNGPIHPILGTQCWLWTASVDKNGRPRFAWGGNTGYAYRYSYLLANGELPHGRQGPRIDHRCHNPICVRPDHLTLSSPRQNSLNRKGVNANNQLGVRGVYRTRNGQKFYAQVRIAGSLRHLGTFDSIEDAAAAVDKCQAL